MVKMVINDTVVTNCASTLFCQKPYNAVSTINDNPLELALLRATIGKVQQHLVSSELGWSTAENIVVKCGIISHSEDLYCC